MTIFFPRMFRVPNSYYILISWIYAIDQHCLFSVIASRCELHTGFGEYSEVALLQLRQGLFNNQVWLGLDVLNKDHFQWPHDDPIKPGCQQASLNMP